MKKRLILTNSIIVSLALIILLSVSCVLISKQNYDTYSNQIKDYLTIATKIFDGSNEKKTVDIVKKSNSDIRITIIDTNGKVVIDSDATNVEENHLEREELQGSNLGKVFKRYSTTLKRDMLYVASLDNGYYVRIALPVGSVRHVISLYVIVSIMVLILIIIFSIILISYVNKLSLNPINKNMKKLADLTSDKKINDEVSIDDLPSLLNDIHLSLNKKIELINKQKEEMITLINSLNQGLIVINSEGIIKIINKKSLAIFNENLDNVIEKNYVYLFRDLHLQDLIKDVLIKKNTNKYLLNMESQIYKCVLVFTPSFWTNGGVIITLEDVTKEENLDKIKRDFFQNASHELKSPLTTIIGYEQMITEGIIDDEEQIKQYSLKTLKEAKRMNSIIMDMLNLSALEQEEKVKNNDVDLKKLILEIIDSLSQNMQDKKITLDTFILDTTINGDEKLLDELIRNLIDNAIKYNKINGKITISLKNNVLKISDTGIGISDENKQRVFERFYRVDKGRSKEQGGTGLGLAIVKHICELYDYKIELDSILEKGTTITIYFK